MRIRTGPCIVSLFLAAGFVACPSARVPNVKWSSYEGTTKIRDHAKRWYQTDDEAWLVHREVIRGRVGVVKRILALRPDLVDVKETSGETLLQKAIRYGKTNIVEVLLESGADVNLGNYYGDTPLHYAVLYGDFKTVSLLLQRGADPNAQDEYFRNTAFHFAVQRGNEDIIRIMVESGSDFHVVGSFDKTPFDYIAQHDRMNIFHRMLIRAVRRGDVKTTTALLRAGISPRGVKDRFGDSLLHIAVRVRNVELVRVLLKRRVYVDVVNRSGETPLLLAARYRDERIAIVLLKAGAYPRARSARGESPLGLAKKAGSRDMVRLLRAPGNWRPGLLDRVASFCFGVRPY